MSLEENKAFIRSLFEVLNKHNPDLLDKFYAPNYVNHTLQLQGLESLKQFESMIYNASADWKETIEDIIAEGNKVWVRYKITGTHTGEFYGLPPTGKSITFSSISIYRIADGKLVEGWTVSDDLNLLTQLGVINYTEKGKKFFPEDIM